MPMDKLKEQSMDMHYVKVKPNVSEMATLRELVFKDIILKSGYKQTKRTSVARSRWRCVRMPCGWHQSIRQGGFGVYVLEKELTPQTVLRFWVAF